MKKEILRYLKLFVGIFICSFGTTIIINANLGLSPWDVFHQGLTNILPVTLGQASILAGIVIITIDIFLGQKLGVGTIINMVFYGIFLDVISSLKIIPTSNVIFTGILMMIIGLFIFSYGCYLYISSGLGCGPRDALMVALTQRTKLSVKFIRNILEMSALTVGYFLGGYTGVGTLAATLLTGIIIQTTFRMVNFNVSSVEHRSLKDEFNMIKRKI